MNDLQVIKEIKPVQGNQIIIDLPKNFFCAASRGDCHPLSDSLRNG